MKMRFFAVPALAPGEIQEEINSFLSSHRVLSVERRLVDGQGDAYWALCVTYEDSGSAGKPTRKGPVDYRELLSASDFAVFAQLRDLRKELSQREGVPPYALFTNEQLATMVRQRLRSAEALTALTGVGAKRVEKYGAAFLEVLERALTGEEKETPDA